MVLLDHKHIKSQNSWQEIIPWNDHCFSSSLKATSTIFCHKRHAEAKEIMPWLAGHTRQSSRTFIWYKTYRSSGWWDIWKRLMACVLRSSSLSTYLLSSLFFCALIRQKKISIWIARQSTKPSSKNGILGKTWPMKSGTTLYCKYGNVNSMEKRVTSI